MKKVLKFLNNIEFYSSYVFIFIMLVVATINVVGRYFFHHSFGWADETCRWSLVWMSVLGAACCSARDKHLSIDLLSTVILKNKPTVLKVVKTITTIAVLIFCAIFIYYGWHLLNKNTEFGSAIRISLKFVYASFPIGFLLMAVRSVQRVILMWMPGYKEDAAIEAGGETEAGGN